MADLLPARFDVVLLGTGLPESIVAAACARVGQSVLHLDRTDYYGGNWASFNLRGLQDWIADSTKETDDDEEEVVEEVVEEGHGATWRLGDTEMLVPLGRGDAGGVTHVEVFYYESEEPATAKDEQEPATATDQEEPATAKDRQPKQQEQREEQEGGEDSKANGDAASEVKEKVEGVDVLLEVTVPDDQSEGSTAPLVHFSDVVKNGRRFNMDLAPNCLFARGAMVELLVKSQVSRYTEFKSVTRILTLLHGRGVQQVPCSRADVFNSRLISVVEKRLLMKLLELSLHHEERASEYEAFRSEPFGTFLRSRRLTPDLRHFVVRAIAMTTEAVATERGLRATRRFLASLGRYGNTPFLIPLYGAGELPQCFCRMSAVFAGTYCLRHSLKHLVVDKTSGRCVAVVTSQGRRVACHSVVINRGFLPAALRPHGNRRSMSRAILITDGSLLPTESDQVSLLALEPLASDRPAPWLLELPSTTHTCTHGTYLVHITCEGRPGGSARGDLEPIVASLFRPATESPLPGADALWLQKPRLLMALYFTVTDAGIPDSDPDGIPDSSGGNADSSGVPDSCGSAAAPALPPNLFLCSGPGPGVDFDAAVKQAEDIFRKICPDEDFCPAAPNPEDLVFDDGNGAEPAAATTTTGSDPASPPRSDVAGTLEAGARQSSDDGTTVESCGTTVDSSETTTPPGDEVTRSNAGDSVDCGGDGSGGGGD